MKEGKMDPIKILKHAWQILWSYRALWVFGLILALAGAGASGRGSNSSYRSQNNSQNLQQPLPQNLHESFQQVVQEGQQLLNEGLAKVGLSQADLPTLLWIAVIFIVFFMVLGIIVAIARYVAETAVIRMVDEYESSGSKMSVKQGFRLGWSRTSWRLFLINLLVNLPVILVVLVLLAVGIAFFQTVIQGNVQPALSTIIPLIVSLFLVVFVVAIASILLRLLRQFFWRACALENLGVMDSLRRGFEMVRLNWKSVGIMWLVMIALAFVWGIVLTIAVVLTIPVVIISAVIAAVIAAVPMLITGGLTSLFLYGWLPWLVGALFVLPLFFTLAFSPWLLLGSWQTAFTSTVWTLVFRELKALPALTNGTAPVPPTSG